MIDCRWKRVNLQFENRHKRQKQKITKENEITIKEIAEQKNNLIKEQYEEN